MSKFTVQDAIDILNKVEDKSRELTLYASTNDPGIPGVLEIFGYVYDIDPELLKDGSTGDNDVVVSAAFFEMQVSDGHPCDCHENILRS